MDARRIHRHGRQRSVGPKLQFHASFLRPLKQRGEDLAHRGVEVGRLDAGLALLGVGEHVHHQILDLAEVLLGHLPALLEQRLVHAVEPHFEDLAAGLESLENVFDMVRQRRDRLADGSETLRVDERLVIACLLDGEGRLVGDGDGQRQVVAGKLARQTARRQPDRRRAGIEIQHAERLVSALHGHADHLANPRADDALHRLKPLVAQGVGNENSLLLAQHVIDDRSADGELLVLIGALAPADRLGLELTGGDRTRVKSGAVLERRLRAQHDAAAIGLERLEDQFEDALQQLIEVESVADGLGGLVHHSQTREGVLQPGAFDLFGIGENPAALGFADGLDDGAGKLHVLARYEADAVSEIAGRGRLTTIERVDENRLADLNVVAWLEQDVADGLVVDEGAVGAADVAEAEAVRGADEFRVLPRGFGIGEADLAGRIAAGRKYVGGERELSALIGPLDDDQAWHEVSPRQKVRSHPQTP